MKLTMKKKMALAAAMIAVVTLASNTQAIQKHDPIFANQHTQVSAANDPDLIHPAGEQGGSPKARKDWYSLNATGKVDTRDLAKEIRSQNGSPRSKQDPSTLAAPTK
jgi:hypothetical protein